MRAHYINVGQGNSTLLEFPCGVVLIDAGDDSFKHEGAVVEYLKTFFAEHDKHLKPGQTKNKIDVLFVTHPHIDHDAELEEVIKDFVVENYVDDGLTTKPGSEPGDPPSKGKGYPPVRATRKLLDKSKIHGVSFEEITAGGNRSGLTAPWIDPVRCGDCDPKITLLSGSHRDIPDGWSDDQFANENNHSLLIRVDFGSASFLFPGDLEEESQDLLATTYGNTRMFDTEVLEVAHHGAKNGFSDDFLSLVSPSVAIISCGAWDDGKLPHNKWRTFTTFAYGHPTRLAIDALENHIANERETPITVKVGDGARKYRSMDISKAIYATTWENKTIVIEANLAGDLEFDSNE